MQSPAKTIFRVQPLLHSIHSLVSFKEKASLWAVKKLGCLTLQVSAENLQNFIKYFDAIECNNMSCNNIDLIYLGN